MLTYDDSVFSGHHSNHQTSCILQNGSVPVYRAHPGLQTFAYVPLQHIPLRSMCFRSTYGKRQQALQYCVSAAVSRFDRPCLSATRRTLHPPLRYRCAFTPLQLRCRSIAGSVIRAPQPAPAYSAPPAAFHRRLPAHPGSSGHDTLMAVFIPNVRKSCPASTPQGTYLVQSWHTAATDAQSSSCLPEIDYLRTQYM